MPLDTPLAVTDRLFYTGLDPEAAARRLREATDGAEDGELFFEYRESEAISLEDGRIRSASFDATRGFGLTKRALNASFANSLDAQLDVEAQAMHEAGRTADYKEGVRAFLEKRAPVYQGK
jgi:enoyl-CoA hydratase/carnithine racemase